MKKRFFDCTYNDDFPNLREVGLMTDREIEAEISEIRAATDNVVDIKEYR